VQAWNDAQAFLMLQTDFDVGYTMQYSNYSTSEVLKHTALECKQAVSKHAAVETTATC